MYSKIFSLWLKITLLVLATNTHLAIALKTHFQRKQRDFDHHQQTSQQRALQRNQARKLFIQQNKQLKHKRHSLKLNYLFNREHTNSTQKSQYFFQKMLNPDTPKDKNKKSFIKAQRRKQKLKKQYPTPLDEHLFSKPLSIHKK